MRNNLAVGIDVGGTSIKAVIADRQNGSILAELRARTPAPDPDGEKVCDAVAKLLTELPGAAGLPVGVVVPGIVDEQRGLAVESANLSWRDVDLATLLRSRLGRSVGLGHDVRAGAIAEARWGAVVGEGGVVAFVPIGTGLAAAILVDGQPIVAEGWAGEVGQLRVGSGPHTGKRVEQVASAAATAERAGEPNARLVAARVRAGDQTAARVWGETIEVIAETLANLTAVTGAHVIVVGGGLALSGSILLDPLDRALIARLGALRAPRLLQASLGDRAAALGATLIAELSA